MIAHARASLALLTVGILLGGMVPSTWAKGPTISDAKVVRWVEKAVAERQATAEEKRFDEIGWVADIRTAIALGKEYNRPIYLFTGHGRINVARC